MEEETFLKIYTAIQEQYSGMPKSLKSQQIKSILQIINGKHTFTLLPTGYGKTLTFVLPPLILNQVE